MHQTYFGNRYTFTEHKDEMTDQELSNQVSLAMRLQEKREIEEGKWYPKTRTQPIKDGFPLHVDPEGLIKFKLAPRIETGMDVFLAVEYTRMYHVYTDEREK